MFIRGPFVAEVGSAATVETEVNGNVVGLRQGNMLATAFHPGAYRRYPHSRAFPEFVAKPTVCLGLHFRLLDRGEGLHTRIAGVDFRWRGNLRIDAPLIFDFGFIPGARSAGEPVFKGSCAVGRAASE